MSTIDELANLDPLTATDDDINALTLKHRKDRETRGRAKKDTGPAPTISLESLGLVKPQPKTTITRRF